MHRFFAYILVVTLMLLSFVPATAQELPEPYTMAGFDGDDVGHNWNENQFFQRMNQLTGVAFTFSQYTGYDDWSVAKAQMLESGQMPDVLFKAELSLKEIRAFDEKHMLLDLAPLLEEHAPNVHRYLQNNEEARKAVTQPDGRILTLPSINELPNNNVVWVNRQWLEQLQMEMPTDAAGFKAMLEAFKTRDPNSNGKQDEIPMTFLGIWDLKFLGHAFGLVANDYNLFVDENNQVQHLAKQPQMRAFVEWLHELYQAKLLDQKGFSTIDTLRKVTDEKAAITYGVLMGPNTMTLLPYVDTSVYQVLLPLEWEGEKVYRDLVGSIYPGAFAISAACQSPEKLLGWIDYLYTLEGGKLALAGQEGVDYEVDPTDGVWEWIGDISIIGQQIISEVTISEGGHLPWRYPLEFQFKYGDRQSVVMLEELYQLRQYSQMPFPQVLLEEEAADRVAALQYDLGLYLDTQLSRFVIGEIEITDETWQSFLDGLEALGLQEFVSLWQAALSN